MNTFVVAGGIVRNRAWILPRHLEAVASNYPDEMFYVFGDCTDDTQAELNKPGVTSLCHDTGEPGYTRDGSDGPRYSSKHMAAERNLWAAEALKRWPQLTHLWVVDSDVLPNPDVLEKLLDLKAIVAAAFVPIADGITPIHMMGWDHNDNQARRTGEEKLLTRPQVVTLVGGCYLIDQILFISCSQLWGEHPQGEDGYFSCFIRFMNNINSRYKMLVDPSAKCIHIMKKDNHASND